jgi:hypothetical protein
MNMVAVFTLKLAGKCSFSAEKYAGAKNTARFLCGV